MKFRLFFLLRLGFKYREQCRFPGIRTKRKWDDLNSLVVGDNIVIRDEDIKIGRNVSIASFQL